ncbi:TPA: hypothetical protein ACX6RX_003190 [Photobacterium damselae]
MIPKKQLNIVIGLMEALPLNGTQYQYQPTVTFCPHDEVYFGSFDASTLNKMQLLGVLIIAGHLDNGQKAVKLVERDDFLASFASGVNEARKGNDLLYADYNSNQYAFSCGYEHWTARNSTRKRSSAYNRSIEYVCHGFICDDTNEVYSQ